MGPMSLSKYQRTLSLKLKTRAQAKPSKTLLELALQREASPFGKISFHEL
jgi:hypothetical protein